MTGKPTERLYSTVLFVLAHLLAHKTYLRPGPHLFRANTSCIRICFPKLQGTDSEPGIPHSEMNWPRSQKSSISHRIRKHQIPFYLRKRNDKKKKKVNHLPMSHYRGRAKWALYPMIYGQVLGSLRNWFNAQKAAAVSISESHCWVVSAVQSDSNSHFWRTPAFSLRSDQTAVASVIKSHVLGGSSEFSLHGTVAASWVIHQRRVCSVRA